MFCLSVSKECAQYLWIVNYVAHTANLAQLAAEKREHERREIAGHGSDFDQLMSVYPKLAQAQAFLDGASFAAANGLDHTPSEPAPAQPEPAVQRAAIQPVAIEPSIGTLF